MAMEGGPYREPKPLSEIIPPDRRKHRVAIIVIASMIAGATLFQIARAALGDADDNPPLPPQSSTEQAPLPPVPPPGTVSLPAQIPSSGPLTSAEVERVVAFHRRAVKQTCWDGRSGTTNATAKITLNLIVGANGSVVDASSSGDDPLVASCVEAQSRTWQFPAHGERSSTIQVPFIFQRM
jgi:hypothetical protein